MMLSEVWRLSVAYIGPKSKTERPRKTKIGKEVAHVTRDSGTTFKGAGAYCGGLPHSLLVSVSVTQTSLFSGPGNRRRWQAVGCMGGRHGHLAERKKKTMEIYIGHLIQLIFSLYCCSLLCGLEQVQKAAANPHFKAHLFQDTRQGVHSLGSVNYAPWQWDLGLKRFRSTTASQKWPCHDQVDLRCKAGR